MAHEAGHAAAAGVLERVVVRGLVVVGVLLVSVYTAWMWMRSGALGLTSADGDALCGRQPAQPTGTHLMRERTLPKLTVILKSSVSSHTARDSRASCVMKEMMLPAEAACTVGRRGHSRQERWAAGAGCGPRRGPRLPIEHRSMAQNKAAQRSTAQHGAAWPRASVQHIP